MGLKSHELTFLLRPSNSPKLLPLSHAKHFATCPLPSPTAIIFFPSGAHCRSVTFPPITGRSFMTFLSSSEENTLTVPPASPLAIHLPSGENLKQKKTNKKKLVLLSSRMERKTQKHKQLKGLFSWLSVSFRFFQFFQLNESLCFVASLLLCFTLPCDSHVQGMHK